MTVVLSARMLVIIVSIVGINYVLYYFKCYIKNLSVWFFVYFLFLMTMVFLRVIMLLKTFLNLHGGLLSREHWDMSFQNSIVRRVYPALFLGNLWNFYVRVQINSNTPYTPLERYAICLKLDSMCDLGLIVSNNRRLIVSIIRLFFIVY